MGGRREAAELYLDLLRACLRREGFEEQFHLAEPRRRSLSGVLYAPVKAVLHRRDLMVVRRVPDEDRVKGEYWPTAAETMLGRERLANVQQCVTDVVSDGVPGDLLEAGVWRGGATILMRATLAAYGDGSRNVWVADSFRGLPKPDPARHPADAGDKHWTWTQFAVSVDDVKANFARYGLLDERVRFLEGWFAETLPKAPIDHLAVLRVDCDMYGSTMDVLDALYGKVSPGGFVIVDDFNDPTLPGCKQATLDFRRSNGVDEEMVEIDHTAIMWRKAP